MNKRIRAITFFISYILLTLIKFFTGVVVGLGDPTHSLVVKIYPTLKNFWRMGEESAANIARYQGTWYFDKRYFVLNANENGFTGDFVYYFLILVWWLLTFVIIIKLVLWIKRKIVLS